MVGSDLEERFRAGSNDLYELIYGFENLADSPVVEVIVAFGGANKDGWRGMKFADAYQIIADAEDGEFGNATGLDAYLYRDDEANMGDESSLQLFLEFLEDGYPDFDQRFLTFWDHGNSYRGFGGDENFDGDQLEMREIERAFRDSQSNAFDLVGFDACLMASMEVAKVIEPYAEYMIASEDLEPGHGWLWSEVIQLYGEEDDVVQAGMGMVDNFVQDVHEPEPEADGKTLSLLDLSQYDQLLAALDAVVSNLSLNLLSSVDYSDSLILASTQARSYGESERGNSRSSIDLMHFARLLADRLPTSDAGPIVGELMDAIDRFVVHSNHDGTRPNSFGIAIDAPENADAKYSEYKVSDAWRNFQSAFDELRGSDTQPPTIVASDDSVDPHSLQFAQDVDGELDHGVTVTFYDENLAEVTALYGFIQQEEYEDGPVEDYFMVVAEVEAYATETEGEYFIPAWDQWWFTVEYDPAEQSAWIPASFDGWFEVGGREYTIYTAEVDYYVNGESEPDFAVLTLIVDEHKEVVDHEIQTYQYIYSGPEDADGTVQFDKATYRIIPGDALQFWNFGFSLDEPANDDWFEASGVITFIQEPIFRLEFLEFEDEFGEPIEYLYGIWAEDVSGNGDLYYPSE